MKKVLFFAACALFVAGMTVSCGSKSNEENTDSAAQTDSTEMTEEPAATEAETETATVDAAADNDAMLAAAKAVAEKKCNCYKTDPKSVENCIRGLIEGEFAKYKENAEFNAAVEREFKACIANKVKDAATEKVNEATSAAKQEAQKVADKAVKDAAKGLSNALTGKKN